MKVLAQSSTYMFVVEYQSKFYHVNFITNSAIELSSPDEAIKHGYYEDPKPTKEDLRNIEMILNNNIISY